MISRLPIGFNIPTVVKTVGRLRSDVVGASKNVSNEFLNAHEKEILACGAVSDSAVGRICQEHMSAVHVAVHKALAAMLDFTHKDKSDRAFDACKTAGNTFCFDLTQAKLLFPDSNAAGVKAIGKQDQQDSWGEAKIAIDKFLTTLVNSIALLFHDQENQGGYQIDRETIPAFATMLADLDTATSIRTKLMKVGSFYTLPGCAADPGVSSVWSEVRALCLDGIHHTVSVWKSALAEKKDFQTMVKMYERFLMMSPEQSGTEMFLKMKDGRASIGKKASMAVTAGSRLDIEDRCLRLEQITPSLSPIMQADDPRMRIKVDIKFIQTKHF